MFGGSTRDREEPEKGYLKSEKQATILTNGSALHNNEELNGRSNKECMNETACLVL
jgi:hypothetical protein